MNTLPAVILDANVLVQAPIRDTLLRLAEGSWPPFTVEGTRRWRVTAIGSTTFPKGLYCKDEALVLVIETIR